MENYRILSINPGSTSTKIAVFENDKPIFLETIKHSTEELAPFKSVIDQYEFRKSMILQRLKDVDIELNSINAVVGRGGLLKPIKSGVYEVNDKMVEDLRSGAYGEHASNLGGLISRDIANVIPNAKAYIADPVVVDELQNVARITGFAEIQRISIFHALNQKVIARKHAKSLGLNADELNLIVVHLGGGISVGAHLQGMVIDVNNALNGDGPISPERAGSVPTGELVKLCYSNKYTYEEMCKKIAGKGGLVALLGTNDAYTVEKMAEQGDEKAKLVQDAMSYQVAKSIGAMAAVLKGEVDGILLTGGIAHNKYLCDYIKDMVEFIAPVYVYPGEDEMSALAVNALMVLNRELESKIYE